MRPQVLMPGSNPLDRSFRNAITGGERSIGSMRRRGWGFSYFCDCLICQNAVSIIAPPFAPQRSVSDCIRRIFLLCRPSKVFGSIIRGIAVTMSHKMSRRRPLPMEGGAYENMKAASNRDFIGGNMKAFVSEPIFMSAEYPADFCPHTASHTTHTSQRGHFIGGRKFKPFPYFDHRGGYMPAKIQGQRSKRAPLERGAT